MDEIPTPESEVSLGESGLDVVDQSRYFVLALAETGWGVWSRGRLTGDPLVSFPPDDDGFNLARQDYQWRDRAERIRRGPWLDILRWLALLSGMVWIIATAISVIRFATALDAVNGSGSSLDSVRWWEAAAQICQPLFLVCLGTYVILWLRVRQHS